MDAEAMGDVGVGVGVRVGSGSAGGRGGVILGRVARWTVRASSRGEELGSNGECTVDGSCGRVRARMG